MVSREKEVFHTEYRISLSDFRKASYCSLLMRYHIGFSVFAVTLGILLLHAIGVFSKIWGLSYILLFVCVAEILWGLLKFGKTEREIRDYIKSDACLLNTLFIADFDALRMRIRIPDKNIDSSIPWTKVYRIVENTTFFEIYISVKDAYIVSRREFSAEENSSVCRLFRESLGDRFIPARFHGFSPK